MTVDSGDNGARRETGAGSLLGVVTLSSAVALSLFGDMAMYVILPVHYVELGLGAIQVGVLLSANRWIRLATNHVAEKMLQRYSGKLLFPVALLLGSVLTAAYSMRPSFAILLSLRMGWGLCWSFIRHTGVMTTTGIAGPNRAGRFMGIHLGIVQVGFVAGTLTAGLLFDGGGFQSTFLLLAAISFAAVPVSILGNHRIATDRQLSPAEHEEPAGGTLSLAIRGFILSLVGSGLIMSTMGFLLRSSMGDALSIGDVVIGVTTVNGVLLAARPLINGVGSPLFGILIDRYGSLRVQYAGFAISAAALLSVAVTGWTVLLIPLMILFFAGVALSRLAIESQAALAGPRAFARLVTSTDLGAAIGPVLGWVGIEIAQSALVFWVGGGLFLVGALAAALTRDASRST